jgi:hypothetical protein
MKRSINLLILQKKNKKQTILNNHSINKFKAEKLRFRNSIIVLTQITVMKTNTREKKKMMMTQMRIKVKSKLIQKTKKKMMIAS